MDTEGAFEEMVEAFADVDVEARVDELQDHFVFVATSYFLSFDTIMNAITSYNEGKSAAQWTFRANLETIAHERQLHTRLASLRFLEMRFQVLLQTFIFVKVKQKLLTKITN